MQTVLQYPPRLEQSKHQLLKQLHFELGKSLEIMKLNINLEAEMNAAIERIEGFTQRIREVR